MRSLLFVPATAPDRLADAMGSGADAVIVDLADSVVADAKALGRAAMTAFVAARATDPDRPMLVVRINGFSTGLADADLDAAVEAGADAILLPKAEGGADITRLDAKIAVAEAVHGIAEGRTRILAMVTETAYAVSQTGTYRGASRRLVGMAWSAEDLSADLGAATARGSDGGFLDAFRLARASTLVGAAAAACAPIDGIYGDLRDLDGLAAECRAAARDGFTAKMAIDPAQVRVINAAFTPSAADVAEARRVVEAFAAAGDPGVLAFDGAMLDRARLTRARLLLARAGQR